MTPTLDTLIFYARDVHATAAFYRPHFGLHTTARWSSA